MRIKNLSVIKALVSLLLIVAFILQLPLVGLAGQEGMQDINWMSAEEAGDRLKFSAPLTSTENILTPAKAHPGTAATFSRASAQYITDFEGVTRKVESNCVAVEGSRVVTNLLTYSEDLSNAAWNFYGGASRTYGEVAPDGSTTAIKVVSSLNGGYFFQSTAAGVGNYTLSVWLKGTGTVFLTANGATGGVSISLTSEWRRYSTVVTVLSTAARIIQMQYIDTSATVYVWRPQVENITAQTNQNPGEYVKTTSAAVTKCFATTNGNTVDANGVVTEATGTALPQSYSERQNSTAYALNDKIQVSGWWYNCTTAGTSASSAPTFPQGKAGSQTVTDGTAVWTIGGRLLLGYVSEPASTNKVTAYGIIPADTLGSELITVEADRTFASDTGFWTKSADVTISGGVCNVTNRTGAFLYRASNLTTKGKVYQITYTATVTSGTVRPVDGTARGVSGTYTENILCVSSDWVEFHGVAFTGSIDNVSVKEVTWAVGTKSYYTGSAFQQNISGLTLSGDVAGVLSIISGTTLTTNAGLLAISPTGKLYQDDNTSGSAASVVTVTGTAGNTNKHSGSIWIAKISGSGTSTIEINGTTTTITGATLQRFKVENVTPASGSQFIINTGIGDKVQFLLPDYEELAYSSSVKPSAGATATRAATSLSYPTAGNLKGNDVTIGIEWCSLNSYSGTRGVFHSIADANNALSMYYDTSSLVYLKKLSGSYYNASTILTLVSNTVYKTMSRLSKTLGVTGFLSGSKMTNSSNNTSDAQIGSSLYVGLYQGGSFNSGTCLRNLRIWFKPLSDDRCKVLTQ